MEQLNFRDLVSEILNDLEVETELKSLQGFSDDLKNFKQRINDDFFRLAVIGEFSSGKSTFINALVGKDILSHAAKETTAVLTRIVNIGEDDPRKGSAVAFMKNGENLAVENLDELKDYTTAVSTKYKVAQEIDAVEIYMPLMHTMHPLMIMDTPGLNGIAEGHFEQTKDIVTKAHACIYLIQQRGLTKDDLEFLTNNLLPYQRRFIFVQNFIDEFKSSEGETLDERINYLRQTLTEKVFKDSPDHTFFICGISALKELASRDTNIKKLYATDTEDLTTEDRKKLSISSNFDSFREILSENFSANKLDEIQYKDTAVAVRHWLESLKKKISRRLADDNEVYQNCHEKNINEKIDRMINRIKDKREDNLAAIRGFIAGEVRKLNKELGENIDEKISKLQEKISEEIYACTSPEQIESKRAQLPKKIRDGLIKIGGDSVDICKISFQDLNQRVMERVEEYSGIRPPEVEGNFNPGELSRPKEFDNKNSIENFKAEIRQKKYEIYDERQNMQTANANINKQKTNIDIVNSNYRCAQDRVSKKQNEIWRMGSRPELREWTEVEERTGFFGTIRDFFGKKEVTKNNEDEIQAWDAQKRILQQQQNKLSLELDELSKQKSAAERVLNRYKQDAQNSAEKIRRREDEIRRLENLISTENERLNKEKIIAREKFVRMCKDKLCEELKNYLYGNLDDGAAKNILDELKKITENNKEKISSAAEINFNNSINQKLEELQKIKQGNISPLRKKITELNQSKEKIEIYIQKMGEVLNV